MPSEVFVGSARLMVQENPRRIVELIKIELYGHAGAEGDGWLTLTEMGTGTLTRKTRVRAASIGAIAEKEFT